MNYFKVTNWDRFQHYKDRNPPWIKLHYELISSQDWVALNDASRVLAVACMLIASRNDGQVPDDPEYIERVAYLNSTPNFKPLLSCGFITDYDRTLADASTTHTNACSESESEKEAETEKDSSCPTSDEVTHDDSKFHLKAFEMSNLLAQLMVDNNPKVKLPATQKQRDGWLLAIDRLNRIDGYAWDEIKDTIKWCQGDDFWKSNILSGVSLRKQFDKLVLAKGRTGGSGRFSNQEKLLRTLKELENGEPEESTCWDSPSIQRADDGSENRRLLGGS